MYVYAHMLTFLLKLLTIWIVIGTKMLQGNMKIEILQLTLFTPQHERK